jgi:hypothetical protein
MNFILDEYPYHADILSTEPPRLVGRVYILDRLGPFPVCNDEGHFIFAVARLEDAVPKFEKHFENYSVPWQPVYLDKAQQGTPVLFLKRTHFGDLRVEQQRDGTWVALRDGLPMLRGSQDATFASCNEAQEAAERHMTDYFYFQQDPPVSDDLHWVSDWKVDGEYVDRLVDRRCRDAP